MKAAYLPDDGPQKNAYLRLIQRCGFGVPDLQGLSVARRRLAGRGSRDRSGSPNGPRLACEARCIAPEPGPFGPSRRTAYRVSASGV